MTEVDHTTANQQSVNPTESNVSRSIAFRFGLALTAVVSLSLILFAGVLLGIDVVRSEQTLQTKLANALRQGQTSLAEPLWNVDSDTVQRFIEAMMLDASLASVTVTDEAKGVVGQGRTAIELGPTQLLTGSVPINYNDTLVGEIEVAISREALESELVQRIAGVLLLTLFIVVAISATAIALTRRYIARPLLNLENCARAIAGGDLEVAVDTSSGDEIGSLAKSLNIMRASIRDLLSALRDSNKSLEDKVMDRTNQLERAVEHAEEARARAEAANVAKSTFLANMSHELRTPLNVILGFAQLMRRDRELIHNHGDTLEMIENSGAHLLTLINDVLDVSKIEAGRLTLETEAVDLHDLLNDIREMFELRAAEKDLDLAVDIENVVPRFVRIDKGRVRQVLINLVGNAIKFTTSGHVKLRVDASPEESSVRLAFEIGDSGPGMSSEELNTLFEPFIQGEAGRQAQQGAGLGLHLSRKFVDLMGGDLQVNSQLGIGSTFQFEILAQREEAGSVVAVVETRKAVSLAPGQSRRRVLIVEDMPESRILLSTFMKDLGFETRTASNGQEAVEIWDEWQPHLTWMDIRMPVMNGIEATERIKAHPRGGQTKVIALTASVFQDERERILGHGCDDFVRKPFREEELVGMLEKHLDLRFIYVDSPKIPEEEVVLSNQTLSLQGLSGEWIDELQAAARGADADRIYELLEQSQTQHSDVAGVLAELVHGFRFDEILRLTEKERI